MSKGLKKIWQSGNTWSAVAYSLYRDSREWRYLLELNPSFDIRSQPAPSVEIPVSGEIDASLREPTNAGLPGTLKQVDLALDLRAPGPKAPAPTGSFSVFPWDTTNGYVNRLGEYTAAAILERDRVNGYTLDSAAAFTTPVGQKSFETTTSQIL